MLPTSGDLKVEEGEDAAEESTEEADEDRGQDGQDVHVNARRHAEQDVAVRLELAKVSRVLELLQRGVD